MEQLVDLHRAGAIIAGAVSPSGNVLALAERTGHVHVFSLARKMGGGIQGWDKTTLENRLHHQDYMSPQAMRFRMSTSSGLELVAVDNRGRIVYKRFDETAEPGSPSTPGPSGRLRRISFFSRNAAQSSDLLEK